MYLPNIELRSQVYSHTVYGKVYTEMELDRKRKRTSKKERYRLI